MYRLIRNIAIAALFISALWASSCNKENDFYEVGRQPVSLTRPQADTVIILDYEHPDSLFTFAWSSRRHFINYKLHFGLDEAFTTSCEQDPGVSESWKLTTMQLDSVLSSMKVGIGETVRLYWTVTVVDPTVGWCDEVRQLTITRCDLPTGLILLTSPENEAEILLDKKTPEAEVAFSWECASTVPDYKLLTEAARAALPAQVAHRDAVYNLSRAALLPAAFCDGRHDLLPIATEDKLHQPYRIPLMPGSKEVFALARECGALAVYVSGAGSTVMAVAERAGAAEFYRKLEQGLEALEGLDGCEAFTLLRLDADNTGATVE